MARLGSKLVAWLAGPLMRHHLAPMNTTNKQSALVRTFYARLNAEPEFNGHLFDRDAEKRLIDRHGAAAAQQFKAHASTEEIDAMAAELKALLTARQPEMGLEALRIHTRRVAVVQSALDELRRQ
jgi:hypothetical protein